MPAVRLCRIVQRGVPRIGTRCAGGAQQVGLARHEVAVRCAGWDISSGYQCETFEKEDVVQELLLLLIVIFAGVALMVFVAERFAASDDATTAKLRRWIMPLVGLLLVVQALRYFFLGG